MSDNIKIGVNTYIEDSVKLGDYVKIGNNVTIIGNVEVGNYTVIQSGAVIGEKPFVYKEDEPDNTYGVIIGDNVVIGANTCIDAGLTRVTKIGSGSKISNLCQIAYDVQIEEGCFLAAKVSVSAKTIIGKKSFVGAGATIRDNLTIGEGAFVGLGAVVKNDVVNSQTVFGNPARLYERKNNIVSINRVNKTFDNNAMTNKTLNDISFEIHEDEFISILGPSGCGKSTLLRIMAGLLEADSGEINKKYNEKNNRIAMVFQEDSLMPWYNVEKNVSLGLKIGKKDKDFIKKKVAWALELVGLNGYEKYYPHQLSGGMRKRVAIARCLVLEQPLMLMDEPFGALDVNTKTSIQEDLLELRNKEKFSVCMVTHDIEEAIFLSDRIVIVKGKPAGIAEIIDVKIPHRRDRDSEQFIAIKQHILDVIQEG